MKRSNDHNFINKDIEAGKWEYSDNFDVYKSIYDSSFINNVAELFNRTDKSFKDSLEKTMLSSASFYEVVLYQHTEIKRRAEAKETFNKLYKNLLSASKLVETINQNYSLAHTFTSLAGIAIRECSNIDNKFIDNFLYKDGNSKLSGLSKLLKELSESAKNSSLTKSNAFLENESELVLVWTKSWFTFWKEQEIINITFTPGHYESEVGYNSECLRILKSIITPLDNKVSESMIYNSIKQCLEISRSKKLPEKS